MEQVADYYRILGVKPTASAAEIERAYRMMVFRYHPDRHPDDPGAAKKFKELGNAYLALSDARKGDAHNAETTPADADVLESNKSQSEQAGDDPQGSAGNFGSVQESVTAKTEAQPCCPACSLAGGEHIISRRGGANSARGKQFINAPFNIVFCDGCGHVYGVTGSAG